MIGVARLPKGVPTSPRIALSSVGLKEEVLLMDFTLVLLDLMLLCAHQLLGVEISIIGTLLVATISWWLCMIIDVSY